MRVFWLQPAAWWGLAALAVPILVHLVARQRTQRIPFPSLRFLRSTKLSAARQWRFADWPLLLVRMLILATTVAAFAAPVFVSGDRLRAWGKRTARAVIVVTTPETGDEVERLSSEERRSAFAAQEFRAQSAPVADSIRDSVSWLARQPPAARELVVIGDLRMGALTAADFDVLPAHVGIRFLPVATGDPLRDVRLTAIAARDREITGFEIHATLGDLDTSAEYRSVTGSPLLPIAVRAAPVHQRFADAALRAVFSEGVLLPREIDRRVTVEFSGAPPLSARTIVRPPRQTWMRTILEQIPNVRGGEHEGVLIIEADIAADHGDGVHLLARVARAMTADHRLDLEPRRISAAKLAASSRPPKPAPGNIPPADEGDRRVLWVAVLALLAAETWLRKLRPGRRPAALASSDEGQARVA